MKYLSDKLTGYILKKGMIQEESYDIYQYGFQCFLELSISTICSIMIAFSLDMVLECMLFFLFFIPMRSYGGGIHMETYLGCFFSSCAILISALLAVKYLTVPPLISFMVYILCVIMIKLIGPVNHPNRKVDNKENRTFIKRTDFTLLISFLIAVIFILLNKTRYIFLETVVFMFLLITSLIGKIKYHNN